MSKRRIVVTGLGALTPCGLSVQETWENVLEGRSGIRTIDHFDTSAMNVKICGRLKGFDPTSLISVKDQRKMDIFTQYGIFAAEEALKDSGLVLTEALSKRFGVAIGSGIGGITTIEDCHQKFLAGGPRKISPFFIPATIINMVAGQISIRMGLKGPNISVVTACTTGTHNIGLAARMIAYGDADCMLAGGAEMGSSAFCISGFAAARALSTRNDEPEKASRPWDSDRDGFVLSEGAGVLVLEEYEHAKRRGAKIYGELVGFGMSADAYHITSPDDTGAGFVATMENALNDANLAPGSIDYINAHGTSTQMGDILEAEAVKNTFGEHAYRLAISSTKSITGHLLGAAGAVEAIFSLLAIRDQIAPPTINLDKPAEGCDLNFVPNKAQKMKIDTALSNSFGFGGTNGSLIFKRLDE